MLVDAETVHKELDWTGLVDALCEMHRGPMPLVDRSELQNVAADGSRQTFFNLPAWLPGRAMGIKMATILPGNEAATGKPSIQSVYQLFDGADGAPRATIDGTALTLRKTAADSALGARFLARTDARALLMVGAGALGPYLIAAHCAVRPRIERVRIWNRTPEKAHRLVEEIAGDVADVGVAEDFEAEVERADVISCATASTSPLVAGARLKPGAHLDLVGAFTPDMRECDDDAVRRARLYVDSRAFGIHRPGDLAQPLAAGIIGEDDIIGDLFDLAGGAVPARESDDQITLFKNGGGGHLDLFTALYLTTRLGARGN